MLVVNFEAAFLLIISGAAEDVDDDLVDAAINVVDVVKETALDVAAAVTLAEVTAALLLEDTGAKVAVPPVGIEVNVASPGNDEGGTSSTLKLEKLPQAMRVLFAKWMTKERLPKKAPTPSVSETKGSMYEDWKLVPLILPCFPERSPTWHVSGRSDVQGTVSPRMYGSRCANVEVQLPSDGTGST
jgi:hypothetical protein